MGACSSQHDALPSASSLPVLSISNASEPSVTNDGIDTAATYAVTTAPCFFNALAEVELHLCLQLLDNRSRVMAARCCRWLLHAASHPFAWRDAEDFVVRTVDTPALVTTLRSERSLVHLVPLSLCPQAGGKIDDSLLALLRNLSNLRALDLRSLDVADVSRYLEMVAYPSPHPSLRRLALSDRSEDELKHLGHMSRLHTLAVPYEPSRRFDFLRMVCIPTLTHLQLRLTGELDLPVPLEQCVSLRDLSLSNRQGSDRGWAQLASISPCMSESLEKLTLRFSGVVDAEGRRHKALLPMPLTVSAWVAFTSLHTLELHHCYGVDSLLTAVASLPALRMLVIEAHSATDSSLSSSMCLSAGAVQKLLDACPLLELTMRASADQLDFVQAALAAEGSCAPDVFSTLYAIARLARVKLCREPMHIGDLPI